MPSPSLGESPERVDRRVSGETGEEKPAPRRRIEASHRQETVTPCCWYPTPIIYKTIRDDECPIRTEHAPANFTTLRHMAHNLVRTVGGKDSLRLGR